MYIEIFSYISSKFLPKSSKIFPKISKTSYSSSSFVFLSKPKSTLKKESAPPVAFAFHTLYVGVFLKLKTLLKHPYVGVFWSLQTPSKYPYAGLFWSLGSEG